MKIGGVDLAERILVMAEIGNNHEGDPAVARRLVEEAVGAGAGAVKLQVFSAEAFVRPRDEKRLEQMRGFELPREEIEVLCSLAREQGALVVATPLDIDSVGFLEPLVDGFKIASGDNDFLPLIERVADTGLPMIVSTGLAGPEDVRAAKEAAEARWAANGTEQELAVLHCVTAYPVPPEAANLAEIETLAAALGGDCTIGYSDHTIGNDACVAAVAMGARILEKHFTLDHHFSEFRDHQLSAEPAELADLVRRAEAAAILRGPDRAAREEVEGPMEEPVRRSIVAAADLPAGHNIEAGDLTWMRPRDGLRPGEEATLVGRALKRDVPRGESIVAEDVE